MSKPKIIGYEVWIGGDRALGGLGEAEAMRAAEVAVNEISRGRRKHKYVAVVSINEDGTPQGVASWEDGERVK